MSYTVQTLAGLQAIVNNAEEYTEFRIGAGLEMKAPPRQIADTMGRLHKAWGAYEVLKMEPTGDTLIRRVLES